MMKEVTKKEKQAGIFPESDADTYMKPAPETFDLFDDIILMAEGKIIYHGPCCDVLEFHEGCGFKCPERKGVADFLKEVISRKDQAQYWYRTDRPYNYVSTDYFIKKFQACSIGQKIDEELLNKSNRCELQKNGISFSIYSLRKLELFRACVAREWLLMKRNPFVYIFKSAQIVVVAILTMTVILRTSGDLNLEQANYCVGSSPAWLKWGFWISPLAYAEMGISANEFLAPKWNKASYGNTSIGMQTLTNRGLNFDASNYWISLVAIFGLSILFDIGYTLALTFIKVEIEDQKSTGLDDKYPTGSMITAVGERDSGRMSLPFEPLMITFQDVQYFVDTPKFLLPGYQAMKEQGDGPKRLQLLRDITGAFRPGILTALEKLVELWKE
ncbi:hypothetical protein IFM89_019729 [Coptis chinensis]|uniref:Uncharacterized protein n=1 Tax=Coptis chinensis TaxID=261450 RepID=A0A835LHT7_9MAGN|nr:hypothetical protein IFM89_019729 [Coptis chinensis]